MKIKNKETKNKKAKPYKIEKPKRLVLKPDPIYYGGIKYEFKDLYVDEQE